jgi:hypothetical protein
MAGIGQEPLGGLTPNGGVEQVPGDLHSLGLGDAPNLHDRILSDAS